MKYYKKLLLYFTGATAFLLIAFSALSLVYRWLQLSNPWLEPVSRHLVLILIFAGGSLAVFDEKHIRMDLVPIIFNKVLSPKGKVAIDMIINLVTVICSLLLFKASWLFYLSEKEYPVVLFGNILHYQLIGILPLGFLILSLSFLLQATTQVLHLVRSKS
jgi:TRAP-type C4-dicarboxylate transport system permease small subunit